MSGLLSMAVGLAACGDRAGVVAFHGAVWRPGLVFRWAGLAGATAELARPAPLALPALFFLRHLASQETHDITRGRDNAFGHIGR